MKKIIALAVAAVVAAPAMADLTISGTAAVGYSASDAAYKTDAELAQIEGAKLLAAADGVWTAAELAQVKALSDANGSNKGNAGFGVDTATITVKGSETLESGLTVSGYFGFGGGARGATPGGEDAGLKVSGDFGSVEVAAKELGNGVYGYGSSVAENFTGELVGAASNKDSIKYTAPAMGAVTLSVGYSEEVGLGKGQDSDFTPDVNAAIAMGDLSGFVNYRFEGDAVGTQRTRFGVKYNAGVAVISAAHEMYDNATDTTNTNFGIDVPVGATTIGLNYGINDAGTNLSGTSVGFKHMLSDNLSVSGKYTKYETAGDDVTKSTVLMSLAF